MYTQIKGFEMSAFSLSMYEHCYAVVVFLDNLPVFLGGIEMYVVGTH